MKQALALFGGTEFWLARSRRAIIAVLLVDVLKGLGGAPQERPAARSFLESF